MILVKYCLGFFYLIIDIKIITKKMTNNCGQCEDLTLDFIHIAPVNLMMRLFNLLQCYVVSFASVCFICFCLSSNPPHVVKQKYIFDHQIPN